MKAIARGFSSIWLTEVDVRRYAALRVAFALVALCDIVLLWPYRNVLFSDAGVVDAAVSAAGKPGFQMPLTALFSSPLLVSALFLLAGGAAVLIARGSLARPALAFLFLFLVGKMQRAPIATAGWDFVLANFAFVLLFSPLGERWGPRKLLGEWRRGRGGATELVPRYGLVLLQLQVFVVYWQTVFLKWPDQYWRSGDFLSYFMLSHHGRFPGPWVLEWTGTLSILTHLTLLVELAIPILLWIPATRFYGLALGAALHLGIAFMGVNLTMFSITMLMSYLAFLEFGRRGRKRREEEP